MSHINVSSVDGARRRHDGRADRAALRQRRHPLAAARPHRRRRPSGAGQGARAEARSAVHARRLLADRDRRLRHAPRSDRRHRLGHGSRGRAAGHQAAAAGARRREAPARHHRQHEHLGHPDRGAGRRPLGRLPPPLARHPLLQPAALPAPAGTDPDGRDRSGGHRRGHARRRPPARQGRGGGEGHAELHRQSHRALRRRVHAAGARQRQVHDRGDRRDHRTGDRPPGLGHVPHHGHRRRGRARPRDAEPERAPGGCR